MLEMMQQDLRTFKTKKKATPTLKRKPWVSKSIPIKTIVVFFFFVMYSFIPTKHFSLVSGSKLQTTPHHYRFVKNRKNALFGKKFTIHDLWQSWTWMTYQHSWRHSQCNLARRRLLAQTLDFLFQPEWKYNTRQKWNHFLQVSTKSL